MKQCTLADLGTIITGKTPSTKQPEYWGGNVPFVTPKDIQSSKHILSTERYLTQEGLSAIKGCVLPRQAICVSCIGNIGYTSITTTTSVSNQQINSIIVNEFNDSDFVYYLIKYLWPYFKKYEGQSTALSILNKSQFSKISVCVPDTKQQQHQIASVLSALDTKIEQNTAINNNLEQQAQALFQQYFGSKAPNGAISDILDEMPKSKIKVGDAKDVRGPYPFFTSGQNILEYTEALVDGRSIFLNTGGNADVKYYIGPAAYSTDTWCIKAKKDMTDMLYLLLKGMQTELDSIYFEGSALRHLQKPKLKSLAIYIPSDEELESFNSIVSGLFNKIAANVIENKILEQTRDALLPKLMSGEIDVSKVDISDPGCLDKSLFIMVLDKFEKMVFILYNSKKRNSYVQNIKIRLCFRDKMPECVMVQEVPQRVTAGNEPGSAGSWNRNRNTCPEQISWWSRHQCYAMGL